MWLLFTGGSSSPSALRPYRSPSFPSSFSTTTLHILGAYEVIAKKCIVLSHWDFCLWPVLEDNYFLEREHEIPKQKKEENSPCGDMLNLYTETLLPEAQVQMSLTGPSSRSSLGGKVSWKSLCPVWNSSCSTSPDIRCQSLEGKV
jgi:hypothetical protein